MKRRTILLLAACGLLAGMGIQSSVAISQHALTALASPASRTWEVLGAARTLPTLYQPMGLAVDAKGDVYVADSGNFRIVEIGPHGQLLAHFGDRDLRPDPGAPAPPSGQAPPGPSSLAVSANGTVYVADPIHHMVRVYGPQHHLMRNWPISVEGVTVLQFAVAVGARGHVIVAIAVQARCPLGPTYCTTYYIVLRLSPYGAVLGRFHSAITPTGPYGSPGAPLISRIATAVDPRGDVYVATDGTIACYKDCQSFHFLTKYTPNGKVLAHWGTVELDLTANWPGLATGGRGSVFVADDYNHRIDKRTSGGTVTARWSLGSIYPTPSQCSGAPYVDACREPSGVAVDRAGNIYASDPTYDRILKLSPKGTLLAQWGAGGSQPGQFWFPASLSLDAAGQLWVNDATETVALRLMEQTSLATNNRLQILGSDGRFHVQFPVAHAGTGMALDRRGNVYIGQATSQGVAISTFSPTGRLLARWGGLHIAGLPSGIAVAPNGDVFVLSFISFPGSSQLTLDGTDILRLSPSGRQLGLIHVSDADTQSGIAVDTAENSYIAQGTTPHFEKYSPSGALVASWGAAKPSYADSFPSPAGIALDSAGNVYVANTPQNVIDEFGPDGTLLHTWGGPGSYPGQFHQPGGIAVGPDGAIYVADTGNHRIQMLPGQR